MRGRTLQKLPQSDSPKGEGGQCSCPVAGAAERGDSPPPSTTPLSVRGDSRSLQQKPQQFAAAYDDPYTASTVDGPDRPCGQSSR